MTIFVSEESGEQRGLICTFRLRFTATMFIPVYLKIKCVYIMYTGMLENYDSSEVGKEGFSVFQNLKEEVEISGREEMTWTLVFLAGREQRSVDCPGMAVDSCERAGVTAGLRTRLTWNSATCVRLGKVKVHRSPAAGDPHLRGDL